MSSWVNADFRDNVIITLDYMTRFGFQVRDTFAESLNLDDQITNGHPNGPRLARIEIADTFGFAAMSGKFYKIKGFQSIAYDAYVITIPQRLVNDGRDDPIIHECVHFLQHSTYELERAYVDYEIQANNYLEYVSQRSEFEAHLVQIAYILERCPNYTQRIPSEMQQKVRQRLAAFKTTPNLENGINAIMTAQKASLI